MTNVREKYAALLSMHKDVLQDQLSDLWRRWAEDLIAAGVDRKEVVETMISVALVQGMALFGASHMAHAMLGQAEMFEQVAASGNEFPADTETAVEH